MPIVKGGQYVFRASAQDNMSDASLLTFEIRVSYDYGKTFSQTIKPQNKENDKFVIRTNGSAENIQLLLKAVDENGNFSKQLFSYNMSNPEITIDRFYTIPDLPEQLTESDICFEISGHTDLIKESSIRIYHQIPLSVLPQYSGNNEVQLCVSYLNPEISEGSSYTIPVSLDIMFESHHITFDNYAYTTTKDENPPTIAFISPNDGSAIPVNQEIPILIKAFDPYGIDRVELKVNEENWQVIENTKPFMFTAINDQAVTIYAKAVDTYLTESETIHMTLQPYSSLQLPPVLSIIQPENGDIFRENAKIPIEIEMQHIDSALLSLYIGADETHSLNPETILLTRTESEPSRFKHMIRIPSVDTSIALMLELHSQGLSTKRIINIINDTGIDEIPIISVKPSEKVLSGTELTISAKPPDTMTDFSTPSSMTVLDSGQLIHKMSIGQEAVVITPLQNEGNINIQWCLTDLSEHKKTGEQIIEKIPYLSHTPTRLYEADTMQTAISHMTSVPQLFNNDNELLWIENQFTGGYYLTGSSYEHLYTSTSGKLSNIYYTGNGIAACETKGLNKSILFWPILENKLEDACQQKISGELIGGIGNLLFIKNGDFFYAYYFQSQQFIFIPGYFIDEPVKAFSCGQKYLFALTDTGIYALKLAKAPFPHIENQFYTALNSMDNILVKEDNIYVWNKTDVTQYEYDEQGTLSKIRSINIPGKINTVIPDHDLLWIQTYSTDQDVKSWQIYKDESCVGYYHSESLVVFGKNICYESSSGSILLREIDTTGRPDLPEWQINEEPVNNIENLLSGELSTSFPSINILKPVNNQEYTEGDPLEIIYLTEESSSLNVVEISLVDDNGVLIEKLFARSSKGTIFIRLPEIDDVTILNIRLRAYFTDDYHYNESIRQIKVYPKLTIPKLAFSYIPKRIMAGSRLHINLVLDETDYSQPLIQVFDHNNQLLSADTSKIDFNIPEDIHYLKIKGALSDGTGVTHSLAQEIPIIHPFIPVFSSETKPFQAALPDIGNAWFAYDTIVHDLSGNHSFNMESHINVMDYYGQKIVLVLENIGLVIIDPDDNFKLVTKKILDGNITHISVSGNQLIGVIQNKLKYFSLSGNDIFENNLQTNSFINGTVLSIVPEENGWFVLTDKELIHIYTDFKLVKRISGQFKSVVQTRNHIFLSTSSGHLMVLEKDFSIQADMDGIQGDKLFIMQSYLIDLSEHENGHQLIIIDIQDPLNPEIIGQYNVHSKGKVNDAIKASGKIWIGGNSGGIIEFKREQYTPYLVYKSPKAFGTIVDTVISDKQYVAAANDYGAIFLKQDDSGQWVENNYPLAFSTKIHDVDAYNGRIYLAATEENRILSLDGDWNQQIEFDGYPFRHLAVTRNHIAASSESKLYYKSFYDQIIKTHKISSSEHIIALASAGPLFFVSTDDSRIYQIDPFNEINVQKERFIQTEKPVQLMAGNTDHLFFAINNVLHQIKLDTFQEQKLSFIPENELITAMFIDNGALWFSIGSQIFHLRTNGVWNELPEPVLTLSNTITSFCVHENDLFIGQGEKGLSVFHLSSYWNQSSPALYSPITTTVYDFNDQICLDMSHPEGSNAVKYKINGDILATMWHTPYKTCTQVPPTIFNGMPFTISAEIETSWGDIRSSIGHQMILRGKEIPSNSDSYSVSLIISNYYLPKPYTVKALIHNSIHDIKQVEYYHADKRDGPFKLIGIQNGSNEAFITAFNESNANEYMKVKAIDVFGNIAESKIISIIPIEDTKPPNLSEITLNGALKNNFPIIGQPYTVHVNFVDNESGVEMALLRKNDQLVAAEFANNELIYNDMISNASEIIQYKVIVWDKAGNQNATTKSIIASSDELPVILEFQPQNIIRESDSFTIYFKAKDDAAIKAAEILWHGNTFVKTFSGTYSTEEFTFDISDVRNKINEQQVEILSLSIIDNGDQKTTQSQPIIIQPDLPPDASKISINFTNIGFYGCPIKLLLNNIDTSDDGPVEQLMIDILDVTSSQEEKIYTYFGRNSVSTMIKAPIAGEYIEFKVRITDPLGQYSETESYRVTLENLPNDIQFVDSETDRMNAALIEAGQMTTFMIKLLDIDNKPIANQKILWHIYSNNHNNVIENFETFTNLEGFSVLETNALQMAGKYRVKAYVQDFEFIEAFHDIEIISGEMDHFHCSYLPPVKAGEFLSLTIHARDSGDNLITTINTASVRLMIKNQGFYFYLADNLSVEQFEQSDGSWGEMAIAHLYAGKAVINLSTNNSIGSYILSVTDFNNSNYPVFYDHDNDGKTPAIITDELPILIIPAKPDRLYLKNSGQSNLPGGDESILEQGEIAYFQLVLSDAYGNSLTSIKEDDALVQVNVSGNAQFTIDQSDYMKDSMVNGVLDCSITDEFSETVMISAKLLFPLLSEMDVDITQSIIFHEIFPSILTATFLPAHNSLQSSILIEYTEPLENSGTSSPITFVYQNTIIKTSIDVFEYKIRVTPHDNINLNQIYSFNTYGSSWRGKNSKKPVLFETGTIRSPQVAIAIPENMTPYFIEETEYNLKMIYGNTIDPENIYSGRIRLNTLETDFSWENESFVCPSFSETSVLDGELLTVFVMGQYNDTDLVVANSISALLLLKEGDFDNDGWTNAFEIQLGLDPLINDRMFDNDNDLLSNNEEITLNTDPNNPDTDNDGLYDGIEVTQYHSDPLDSDTDDDGLSDGIEVDTNNDPTDPLNIDILDYVTSISVNPKNMNVYADSNSEFISISVLSTISVMGIDYQLDVTRFNLISPILFFSTNKAVAVPYTEAGLFKIVSYGTTELSAQFGEYSDTCILKVFPDNSETKARLMPLSSPQALYAGADYGEVYIEISHQQFVYPKRIFMDGQNIPLFGLPPELSNSSYQQTDPVLNSMPHSESVYGEVISGWGIYHAPLNTVRGKISQSVEESVFYHYFQVTDSNMYILKIISADFDPEICLLKENDPEKLSDVIERNDDFQDSSLPAIRRFLDHGNYVLAVGGYPFSAENAVSGENTSDEFGNFTLSVSAPSRPVVLKICYPNGVPEDIQGEISLELCFSSIDYVESETIYVPVFNDPLPEFTIYNPPTELMQLHVGDILDFDISVSDLGFNTIGIQYYLDGIPLEQEYVPPYPVLKSDTIKLASKYQIIETYDNYIEPEGDITSIADIQKDGPLSHVQWEKFIIETQHSGNYALSINNNLSKHAAIMNITHNYELFWPDGDEKAGLILFDPESDFYLPKGKFILFVGFGAEYGLFEDNFIPKSIEQLFTEPYLCRNCSYETANYTIELFETNSNETQSAYPEIFMDTKKLYRFTVIDQIDSNTATINPLYFSFHIEVSGTYCINLDHDIHRFSAIIYRNKNNDPFNKYIGYISDNDKTIKLSPGAYTLDLGIGVDFDLFKERELRSFNCKGCSQDNAVFHIHLYRSPYITETTDLSYFIRYNPITDMNRLRTYQKDRRAYIIQEKDLGTHSLDIVAHENTISGSESLTLAQYTVNILPSVCMEPAIESVVLDTQNALFSVSKNSWINENIAHFDPLTIKIQTNNSPLVSIDWINRPYPENHFTSLVDYHMLTIDGVYYTLMGESAYRSILNAKLNMLEFQVTTQCGSQNVQIPIELFDDEPPEVVIQNPENEFQFITQQSQVISLEINDIGKNVLGIAIALFQKNEIMPDFYLYPEQYRDISLLFQKSIMLSQYRFTNVSDIFNETILSWDYWAQHQETYQIRIPISVPKDITSGDYDLRLISFDRNGKFSVSSPYSAKVLNKND